MTNIATSTIQNKCIFKRLRDTGTDLDSVKNRYFNVSQKPPSPLFQTMTQVAHMTGRFVQNIDANVHSYQSIETGLALRSTIDTIRLAALGKSGGCLVDNGKTSDKERCAEMHFY